MKGATLVAFEIVSPLLTISIAVRLLVAIFQTVARIHEQALTFVPRLIVIVLVLLALESWVSKVMNESVVGLFTVTTAL